MTTTEIKASLSYTVRLCLKIATNTTQPGLKPLSTGMQALLNQKIWKNKWELISVSKMFERKFGKKRLRKLSRVNGCLSGNEGEWKGNAGGREGNGSHSHCSHKFNLPDQDTVTLTKNVWNQLRLGSTLGGQ